MSGAGDLVTLRLISFLSVVKPSPTSRELPTLSKGCSSFSFVILFSVLSGDKLSSCFSLNSGLVKLETVPRLIYIPINDKSIITMSNVCIIIIIKYFKLSDNLRYLI